MIPKFRGFSKKTKKMYSVEGFKTSERKIYRCSLADDEFHSGCLETFHFVEDNLDNYILMQSTGLFDKNGVEVFEGDVVRYTWDMLSDVNATEKGKKFRISKVFWSDWRASWAVGKKFCNNDLFRYTRNGNTVEIIGNIYQNSGLLESVEE